jgi:hypothetical protein
LATRVHLIAVQPAVGLPWFLVASLTHLDHFHHFIAVVVDHLHGGPSCRRGGKWPTGGLVEGAPRFLIDICTQCTLQRFVWLVALTEVGVADEENLLVVVRVDELAGEDVVRDFATINRWRARANAMRLVSMVIQRLPHCAARYAVVPLPQ